MEIPGRRPQPYISDFPAVESTIDNIVEGLESPLHKAKSEKELSSSLPAEFTFTTRLSLSRSKSKSQEAGLQRAVSASPNDLFDLQCKKELEELIEQLQDRPKKRYSSITVPLSVKYSTNMSRPRSPKKGNELAEKQAEQEKMQDDMDQTLLRIREQLGMLTSERVAMEGRMDELTTGIKDARIQCYNQCRQKATANRIRRARSSTYHSPRLQRMAPPKPIAVHSTVHERQPSSPTLLSPDSIVSNPEYYVPRHRSASSTDSGYGSLNRKSKFTELKSRSSFSSTPNMSSLSQPSETYGSLSNATIPELPESPCFSQPNTPYSNSFSGRIMSNPSLHYSSKTVPKHFRSQSTSIAPPMINVTSSPELTVRRRHDSVPAYQLSHRNSMPESVMNKIIEDEIDAVSVSDSLSQASLSQLSTSFMEEGSPMSQGSTVIVRRSSLTGQVEHIRRPRKRNSFNGSTESEKSGSRPAFRVLNTGYKRNRKNKVILPNSIETTV